MAGEGISVEKASRRLPGGFQPPPQPEHAHLYGLGWIPRLHYAFLKCYLRVKNRMSEGETPASDSDQMIKPSAAWRSRAQRAACLMNV